MRTFRQFSRSFTVNAERSGTTRYDSLQLTSLPSPPSIHPRLLFVHSPIPFCIAPKGRSPRLFPLRAPLIRFARFVQRHGYFCCSSRCSSFFSCCVLLLLPPTYLLPPTLRPPLLSLSLRLRSVPLCPEIRFSFFLPALRSLLQAGPVASFVLVE